MMKRVVGLLLLALALWGGAAQAQVVVDAKSASYVTVGSGTTITIPLTVGAGTNRALGVMLFFGQTALPTFSVTTWNTSQTMTVVSGSQSTSTFQSVSSVIYCLPAPASGAHNAVFTWTGALEAHGVAISFTGADQTTPCQNGNNAAVATSASPAAITVTSAAGDIAIATEAQNCTTWGTVSGTTIATDISGPAFGVAANYDTGAASVTLSAAFPGTCAWSTSGADVKAAAGGGATAKPRLMPLTGAGR